MPINTEMFNRIQDVILSNPERHDQHYFETGATCGTTRCVAGWAIHLWGLDNGLTGSIEKIGQEYIGFVGYGTLVEDMAFEGESDVDTDAEVVGAHILGLNRGQAYELFFNMNNDDALRMVKEYAQGNTDVQRS